MSLGWTGTLQGGHPAVPAQRVRRVPDDAVHAPGRADGAGRGRQGGRRAATLRIWWNVVLPAVRPGMACARRSNTFMLMWNDFMWPLIVLDPGQPDRADRDHLAQRQVLHELHVDLRGHGAVHHPAHRGIRRYSAVRSSADSWKVRSRRDDSRGTDAFRPVLPSWFLVRRGERRRTRSRVPSPRTGAAFSIWDTFTKTPGRSAERPSW